MKRLFITLITIYLMYSQAYNYKMFSAGIETITDFDDISIGLTFLVNTNEKLSIGSFWVFRPYEAKVYVPSGSLKIRYLETRSVFGLLGLYVLNPDSPLRIGIEGGVSFSIASYAGTAIDAESYIFPFGGLNLNLFTFYDTSFNVGYRFLKITETSEHQAKFSINYGF